MEIDLIKQLYLLKWYEQEGIYELVKNQPINRTQNNDNDMTCHTYGVNPNC